MLGRIFAALLVASVIGSAAFGAAWYLRDVTFIGNLTDQARDVALALNDDARDAIHLKKPLVFVAIDAETFQALGRPAITPKERVARLLRNLLAAKPALIILDIDISWPTTAADAKALTDVLNEFEARQQKLLIVRQAMEPIHPHGAEFLRATPFDTLIRESKSISWVTAEAIASSDGIVRRIQPWTEVCQEGPSGHLPTYLQGVGIAASNAIFGEPTNGLRSPDGGIITPQWRCDAENAATRPIRVEAGLKTQDRVTGIVAGRPQDFVRYSLGWHEGNWVSTLTVKDEAESRPLAAIVSANPLLQPNAKQSVSADLFRDSIVVVGASHRDSGDRQLTPLGHMPGAFIVLNHVRGILDFGPEGEDAWIPGLIATISMSAITALIVVAFAGAGAQTWLLGALPLIATAIWWLGFTAFLGSSLYVGLAAIQFAVGVTMSVVSRLRRDRRARP
jgi:CHASE2 domain-containing sensor protein